WKSACVLSVKQPDCDAALRPKFRVAVPPSGTAMVATDAVSKPDLLALSVGYVPAGSVNEYCPLALVVVVRLPSVSVTPASGFVPSVTRPERGPLPTVEQPGWWNEPIRVWWFRPVVAKYSPVIQNSQPFGSSAMPA